MASAVAMIAFVFFVIIVALLAAEGIVVVALLAHWVCPGGGTLEHASPPRTRENPGLNWRRRESGCQALLGPRVRRTAPSRYLSEPFFLA